jgi:hypothetical protein
MRRLWHRAARLAGLVGLLAGLALLAEQSAAGDKKGDSTLKVKEGQPAPNVELPATQIESVLPDKKGAKTLRLGDLKGKKNVVLYFFPKALTGG